MQGQTTLAAGASNPNAVSGQLLEYVPFNSHVQFSITADAANAIVATLYVGTEVIAEAIIAPNTGKAPSLLDVTVEEIEAYKGDKIKLSLLNQGAAQQIGFWKFIFDDNVHMA